MSTKLHPPEWFDNSTPAVPATSSDTATVMDCGGDYSVTVLAIIWYTVFGDWYSSPHPQYTDAPTNPLPT